jgi:hypothetical protein
VLPQSLSARMEGPAESPRDLSCAAIDAEGTCDAARFWAKIASRTRQGGSTERPVPQPEIMWTSPPAVAAWHKILSAERCGQPCLDSPMMASARNVAKIHASRLTRSTRDAMVT